MYETDSAFILIFLEFIFVKILRCKSRTNITQPTIACLTHQGPELLPERDKVCCILEGLCVSLNPPKDFLSSLPAILSAPFRTFIAYQYG